MNVIGLPDDRSWCSMLLWELYSRWLRSHLVSCVSHWRRVLGVAVEVHCLDSSLMDAGRGNLDESRLCLAVFSNTGIMCDINNLFL
jgi:hypothetical protein